MYRILSLDGGGIYGALTVTILKRMAATHPDFFKNIDLIAGTSVGGMIALAIANGADPEQLVEILRTRTADMFSKTKKRSILAALGQRAFYSSDGRKKVFKDLFGDRKLHELNKKIVIPAFELDNADHQWRPKLFHNFPNPVGMSPLLKKNLNKTSRGLSAVDVAMSTSAAPIYFPAYDRYIDGGVIENNPAMAAIAQVLDPMCLCPNKPKLEDIIVMSVGTGSSGDYIPGRDVDWGWMSWVKILFSIFLHGDISTTDYQCRQLLGNRYHKICPLLPNELNRSMDDLSLVSDLIEYGEQLDLTEVDGWLDSYWK